MVAFTYFKVTTFRPAAVRSIRNESVAQIHSCETARDMRETAVSRWGVSRETARDSARQRETARDSARQPRDSRESDVNPCDELVNCRPTVTPLDLVSIKFEKWCRTSSSTYSYVGWGYLHPSPASQKGE